jgi:hypothetical protein
MQFEAYQGPVRGGRSNNVVGLALTGIFSLGGLGMLGFGGHKVAEGRASEGWPTAGGKVTASSVATHRSYDSHDHREHITYGADVRYTFEVAGAAHTGKDVTLADMSTSSRSSADETVGRYPVGREVQVHYDPDDPDHCCLEPGLGGGVYVILGVGGSFAGVGLLISFVIIRRMLAPLPGVGFDG